MSVQQRRTAEERLELPSGQRVRANVAQSACIAPGIALGAIMSRATRVRDEMIIAAAQACLRARCLRATITHDGHYMPALSATGAGFAYNYQASSY